MIDAHGTPAKSGGGRLQDRPNDEKRVIAGGAAITVVVILMIGWAILFLKKIQQGAPLDSLGGTAQDEFNFSSVREAEQQLMDSLGDTFKEDELRQLRDRAAGGSGAALQPTPVNVYRPGDTDQFGSPVGNY